jgi:hypothetical protein
MPWVTKKGSVTQTMTEPMDKSDKITLGAILWLFLTIFIFDSWPAQTLFGILPAIAAFLYAEYTREEE